MDRIKLLLADDDPDDRALFMDALTELDIPTNLTAVQDGEQLMRLLEKEAILPDVIFLDLNMPRKNGAECLMEIQAHEELKQIPVIIFSTSYDQNVVQLLYHKGAKHYIRKPYDFNNLVKVIDHVLSPMLKRRLTEVTIENFVIKP